MADSHTLLASASAFDWDVGNATKNWARHAVSRSECEQLFFHAPLVLAPDALHSQHEDRWFALGHKDAGRLLFVVFTLREFRIRVISARPMSRREREVYANVEAEEDQEASARA